MVNISKRCLSKSSFKVWFFIYLLFFVSKSLFAQQTTYYLLGPEAHRSDVELYSLENNNVISSVPASITLQKYERASFSSKELRQGQLISGSGYFDIKDRSGGTSLAVPSDFLGTSFAVPHIEGRHHYYLLSPEHDAQVSIEIGDIRKSIYLQSGVVSEIDAGINSASAGVILSDSPIVVGYLNISEEKPHYAYAVPPAHTEIYGVQSKHVVVGAVNDDTIVTAYADDGSSAEYVLDKGNKITINIGSSASKGKGSALRIAANLPINAVQFNDGDGKSATAFLPAAQNSQQFAFSQDTRYAAAVCPDSEVELILYSNKGTEISSRKCTPTGAFPGKAYFGSDKSKLGIDKNSYLIASNPVYLISEEASRIEQNHFGMREETAGMAKINALGFTIAAAPAAPALNAIPAATTVNPLVVTGTSVPNIDVKLYVNGALQATVKSSGTGTFSFSAILADGNNSLYVTAINSNGEESVSSAVRTTAYTNTISRAQGGAISGTIVWTPGIPSQPYVISSTDLTVTSGSKLIISAGTELRFGTGRRITVSGSLVVNGTSANPVVFTSNATSKVRGDWQGISIAGSGSTISYATVEYASTGLTVNGVATLLRNSSIRYFSMYGINVTGAGASGTQLQNNLVDNLNDSGTCVYLLDTSPSLAGNTLQNCSTGLNITMSAAGTMSPTVTGNNVITSNGSRGIYVTGSGSYLPSPVITGNQIFGNVGFDFYVENFSVGGSALLLNASSNWWGTTDPSTIALKIRDFTDVFDPTSMEAAWRVPIVDYRNFLNAANGSPRLGNYLMSVYDITMLTSGVTYDVLGTLLVSDNRSLTIPENVILRFHSSSQLYVGGKLYVDGTSSRPVIFTSGRSVPARGDWKGIVVRNYGPASNPDRINNARVEYATTGIDLSGIFTVGNLQNNTVRYFTNYGIYVSGGNDGTQLVNNVIDNTNDTGTCVYINNVSPALRGNTLQNCRDGLIMRGTAITPVINQNNIITNNSNSGVSVVGTIDVSSTSINPAPAINGNQIFGNGNYEFYTEKFNNIYQTGVVNAKANWWGTIDPNVISARIVDISDNQWSTTLPIVDFKNFLNGPNGSPVAGNFLIGSLTETTLTAGNVYDVYGAVYVPINNTVTIPANTTMRFRIGTKIQIDGTLIVNGTSSNPVLFTSLQTPQGRGDWGGISLSGSGSTINYATVEYATTGIAVKGGTVSVRNSIIRNFTTNGIQVTGAGANSTQLQNNLVDNLNDTGICVYVENSSPTLIGNTLRNCSYGLTMVMSAAGTMAPAVNGNNIITSNGRNGISVSGSSNYTPRPVITGNQIFGNTRFDFSAENFATGAQTITLNATGNWWGSSDPSVIVPKIDDFTDQPTSPYLPIVDFRNFLNAANGSAVQGNYLLGSYATTTLSANTTYDVLGVVLIPASSTFTIPASTTLRFYSSARIVASGALLVNGTSSSPVKFTSAKASPVRGDWGGITLSGSGSTISYATVEYATAGITINGVAVTLRSNTLRYFSTYGIYVTGSGASGTQLQNNLVDNLNDTATCVYVENSSPTLVGNTVKNCSFGLRMTMSIAGTMTPSVTGNNIITSNGNSGISVSGSSSYTPRPVVTGNQIFENTSYDFYTERFATGAQMIALNATGNWWGSSDPSQIAPKIYDLADQPGSISVPIVDFRNFLNIAYGSAVQGNYLLGSYATTTLNANTTYDVLGLVIVPAGSIFTIPANTTLRFYSNARIVASGALLVNGTSNSPVTFTSNQATPRRGDWGGITLSGSGSTISYATVEYATAGITINGVVATLRSNTLRYFSTYGISVTGSGASGTQLQNNLVDNLEDAATCAYVENSSPTLTGNTLQNCSMGLNMTMSIAGTMAPTVNGNNVITSNGSRGVYVTGSNSYTPQPVVTGNQIFGNASYDFYTQSFAAGAQSVKLNATGNWWGSTDPTAIAGKIQDLTDSPTSTAYPVVNFGNYLNAPNGTAVAGNYLIGNYTTTSLTAGTTYDVLGVMLIPSGNTLTIPANTTLRFHSTAQIRASGALVVNGASSGPVIFTSGQTTKARGDWQGITLSGSGSSISYTTVEYATTGITASGVAAILRNNIVRYFSVYGLQVTGSGASGSQLQYNLVDNFNDTATCVYVENSSPTLTGNTLQNCADGLNITMNTTGTVTPTANGNNVITSNGNSGVYVYGANSYTPRPVVTGNQIFGNANHDFYTNSFASGAQMVKLNATGNWWGSADPTAIASKIYDFTDQPTTTAYPVVNFGNYLNAANGTTVAGNYLIGYFDDSVSLTANSTYTVLGVIGVPSGRILTIPAGTMLKFYGAGSQLLVSGTLNVQGTSSARTRFTSGAQDQVKGAWGGIKASSSTANVSIDFADIEFAVRAISATGGTVSIKNSLIRNFSDSGIHFTSVVGASVIASNYIDNGDKSGYGIYLASSSPNILGNRIVNTSTGIYLTGTSNPSITGNYISGNDKGIVLYGSNSNSAAAVPNPVITGNDIFGNTTCQLEIANYGSSNPVVVNATNNWWGTATPVAGQHIRYSSSPTSALNFSNPAASPKQELSSTALILSEKYISPNNDAVKDVSQLSATLNKTAAWSINVYSSSNQAVRSYSGTNAAVVATLNGRNGSNQILPDGLYRVELVASGSAGSVLLGVQSFVVDNSLPSLTFVTPASGATLRNILSVLVSGSVQDGYLVNYVLEYGVGASPIAWTQLNTGTSNVAKSILGTWTVSNTNGAASVAPGAYVLRLRASDKAGNASQITLPITLDILGITSVSQNVELFRPMSGEQLRVNFTISAPATVQLRIYTEASNELVRQIQSSYATAGAQSLSWDGRDTQGQFVDDEAYKYTIYATSGESAATYDTGAGGLNGSGTGIIDSSFNAHRNDYWKMDYNLPSKGRVRMQVSGCSGSAVYPYNWVALPAGVHNIVWDGRDASGRVLSGSCNIYFDAPKTLAPASVIVKGVAPIVSGNDVSPNVEVKSNPYLVIHSYESIAKMVYRVSQDAYVTIKLLPPGVADFNHASAIVLVNNELKRALNNGNPVDQTVEWKGFLNTDTNNILVSADGTHTFAIRATSSVSGKSSLYKGSLQLIQ